MTVKTHDDDLSLKKDLEVFQDLISAIQILFFFTKHFY